MKILAIETSTSIASLALLQEARVVAVETSYEPKSHSDFVNPALDRLLKKSGWKLEDLDQIALDNGPGSFTGLRVAVNLAKTLGYALNKPIVALQSVFVMGYRASFDEPVITMLNAYKNMVYCAILKNGQYLAKPDGFKVTELESHISKAGVGAPLLCLGEGYAVYESQFTPSLKNLLKKGESSLDHPSVYLFGEILEKKIVQPLGWNSILPLYIRPSSAEENFKSS